MDKNLTCGPSELSEAALHNREARFHDTWASETKLDDILVRESFEAPTAVENQFKVTSFPDAATERNVGGDGTASPSAMGSTRNFLNSRTSRNFASMPSS